MAGPLLPYADFARLPSVPNDARPTPGAVEPEPPPYSRAIDPNSEEGQQILQRVAEDGRPGTLDLPEAGTQQSQDSSGAIASEVAADQYLLRGGGPRGPQKEIISGRKYGTVGGKDLLDSATESRPEQVEQALNQGAAAAGQEGQEMAKVYQDRADEARQAAVVHRAQALEDQDALKQRQDVLDQQAQAYTADLNDQGKFWRNPGNIVAAIAFSLMPVTSNDPGVGVKLINQAVQQDLANRRATADMHLGELRSNLGEYRKLAGSREAGNQLAEAEAYRVAAQDIQRIGASYQGAKAQAQAQAMSAEFQQKADILRMNVFAAHVNLDPAAMDPRMAQAWRNHNGVVLDQKGKPTVGATPGGLPSQQGAMNAYGKPVGGTTMPQDSVSPGQPLMPGASVSRASEQPAGGVGKGSFEGTMGRGLTDLLDERNPGSPRNMDILDQHVSLLASRETGLPPDDRGPQMQKARVKIIQEAKKEVEPAMHDLTTSAARRAGYTAMQRDVNMLEKRFRGNDASVSAFLGGIRRFAPESDRQLSEYLAKVGMTEDSDKQMARRFQQVLNKNVNAYFKDTSGGAISPSENKRLEAYISGDATWSAIKNFTRDMSSESAKEYQTRVSGLTPLAREYATIRLGQELPGLNTPGKK